MSQGAAFGNRWWIVFGATLSMLVAQGPVILYTLGLFIKPLNQEFGWDRASISAAGGIAAIFSAITVPFVDRSLIAGASGPFCFRLLSFAPQALHSLPSLQNQSSCSCCCLQSPVFWDRARGLSVMQNASLPGLTTGEDWPWE
jgi:hypothetical protein